MMLKDRCLLDLLAICHLCNFQRLSGTTCRKNMASSTSSIAFANGTLGNSMERHLVLKPVTNLQVASNVNLWNKSCKSTTRPCLDTCSRTGISPSSTLFWVVFTRNCWNCWLLMNT